MREIKFRAWFCDKMIKPMSLQKMIHQKDNTIPLKVLEKEIIFMQYTGLKDKNGLTEIYEGDIINENGLVIGNIYEMDKRETDTVIQGLGSKTWCETVSRAILLGCRYSE